MFNWKFWQKEKQTEPSPAAILEPTTIDETTPIETTPFDQNEMLVRVNNVNQRRSILDWRDKHEINIQQQLRVNLFELKKEIDSYIEDASFREIFFNQKKFINTKLEPKITSWIKKQTSTLLKEASEEIIDAIEQDGKVYKSTHSLAEDDTINKIIDVSSSIGPMAAGILAVPAAYSASFVSAGGILGLFSVTVISWPVAIVGALSVGGAILIGGYKTSNVRIKANDRLKNKIFEDLQKVTFGSEADNKSLCKFLQEIIRETSQEQLRIINGLK